MLKSEIQQRAKVMGMKSGNMKKDDLIRAIQAKEGNTACFDDLSYNPCPSVDCAWKEDCRAHLA